MKRTRFLFFPALAILLLLIGLLGLGSQRLGLVHASGTTVQVTNCHDSGPGSLRNAITSAARGSTITFSLSCDIKLNSTLVISKTLTLDGEGQQVTLDGQQAVGVLSVNEGVTFTLKAFTIANGSSDKGGGITNYGTLSISNSTVSGNSGNSGIGIFNKGTLSISNSTVSGNSGPGILNGIKGTLSISNSTVSGNSGPGISNSGTLSISNSTVSGNFGAGGIDNDGSVSISNSTVSGNSGGGIFNVRTLSIGGSIVANNTESNCPGYSPLTDQGYNLSSDTSCHFTASTSLQNTDPKLDPAGLANNGGPTQTIALQPDSPAVDQIPVGSSCPATDQRGVSRPRGPKCDLGAFEMTAADGLKVMIHVVNSFQLAKDLQTSLDQQVQTALADQRAHYTTQACQDLTSFSNNVQAQSGKGLTTTQATQLLNEAAVIHTRLGC